MKSQPVPSYNELFQGSAAYESLLTKLSKESVIITCIAIINELNSIEEKYDLQKRIYEELAQTFPAQEKARIDKKLSLFWQKKRVRIWNLVPSFLLIGDDFNGIKYTAGGCRHD